MWPYLSNWVSLQCLMGLRGCTSLIDGMEPVIQSKTDLPYFHQGEPCTPQPRPKKINNKITPTKKGIVTEQTTIKTVTPTLERV